VDTAQPAVASPNSREVQSLLDSAIQAQRSPPPELSKQVIRGPDGLAKRVKLAKLFSGDLTKQYTGLVSPVE
jgi:hypothetical protein